MNVNITGIGPMTAAIKGADALSAFDIQDLWSETSSDWFDPKMDLGGRGFKYFNSATRYLLAAVRQFEPAPTPSGDVGDAEYRGVTVGSNSCTRTELDAFDQALLERGYNAIDPMRAPSFCANVGTGTVSIKQRAKAFNITLMNPFTAGLESVVLAKEAIAGGRASTVISGAMEDDGRFSLGRDGYPMTTTGGAWAVRLQADEASPDGTSPGDRVAGVGLTLNRFFPDGPTTPAQEASLVGALQHDLAPLNGDGCAVYMTMLNDSHSQRVANIVQRALTGIGVDEGAIHRPIRDTLHGTLYPLAQLSWCALHIPHALCVAISPLGHLTMVELLQDGAGRD